MPRGKPKSGTRKARNPLNRSVLVYLLENQDQTQAGVIKLLSDFIGQPEVTEALKKAGHLKG